jgi:phosphatidylglycerol---prolipoprotein diacylglyceryl transferase
MLWRSVEDPQLHFALETLAYFVGARLYWQQARGTPQPPMGDRLLLLGCVLMGALFGSKALHLAHHLDWLLDQHDPQAWLAGKSILGGFLGGTLGAEIGKQLIGWRPATGDGWVLPITVGLAIGRLGCQLSGTWDQTYGIPTTLLWGWDYGDGIARHPTALYEILLVIIAWSLTRLTMLQGHPGARFALFFGLYCLIRLLLEFLKPPFGLAAGDDLPISLYHGLTAIQWTAIFGMVWYSLLLAHRLHQKEVVNG